MLLRSLTDWKQAVRRRRSVRLLAAGFSVEVIRFQGGPPAFAGAIDAYWALRIRTPRRRFLTSALGASRQKKGSGLATPLPPDGSWSGIGQGSRPDGS